MTFEIYRTSRREVNYPGVVKNDKKYSIEMNNTSIIINFNLAFFSY